MPRPKIFNVGIVKTRNSWIDPMNVNMKIWTYYFTLPTPILTCC